MTDAVSKVNSHLNSDQKAQVQRQYDAMQHESYVTDIHIAPGFTLRDFQIHKGVWDPTKTSARHVAGYLFYNNRRLLTGGKTLDMGCGTGLLGIVAGHYSRTDFADISELSVANTKANTTEWTGCFVRQSNLFSDINDVYNCIVFNHPFFQSDRLSEDTIVNSMLAPWGFVSRFLRQAKGYLKENGTIVMPFFSVAGTAHDPNYIAHDLGYVVNKTWEHQETTDLQKGMLSICELKLK